MCFFSPSFWLVEASFGLEITVTPLFSLCGYFSALVVGWRRPPSVLRYPYHLYFFAVCVFFSPSGWLVEASFGLEITLTPFLTLTLTLEP